MDMHNIIEVQCAILFPQSKFAKDGIVIHSERVARSEGFGIHLIPGGIGRISGADFEGVLRRSETKGNAFWFK